MSIISSIISYKTVRVRLDSTNTNDDSNSSTPALHVRPRPTSRPPRPRAGPDVVRLAARLNATLLPFSGLGGDDSFAVSIDSDELLQAPLIGPFFRERVAKLPSLVKDDVFVPPVGQILPERYYFAFGAPLTTDQIAPDDDAAVEAAYAELRARVLGGIDRLRELRERDPYSDFTRRTAYEVLNGVAAPPP